MDWYIWLIIGVCAVIAILLAIIIIRTLCFKSPKEDEREVAPLKIDENNQVEVNLYNNYDFTKQTSDYIRNGIFSLESNIDLINETEKNRK